MHSTDTLSLSRLRLPLPPFSQALLCWRSGVDSKTGGEFALLDPNTHRFVAAYSGASNIVDVSGFVLSPCSRSEGPAISLQSAAARPITARRSLEVLGGGVRVLHGGDLAKVTMLYHNAEGEAWSSCSSEVTDNWGVALSAEAAARRVQRAWRAARQRRMTATTVAAAVAAVAPPPADSRVSPRTLRMPGEFSRGAGASPPPAAGRKEQHGASVGDAGAFEDAGAQAEATAEAPASSGHRKREGRGSSRVPEPLRGDKGGGGGKSRRKTSRSPFSVRDSIEALDAADLALQLSSHPGGSGTNSGEGENEDWQRWASERTTSGTVNAGHGGSNGAGGGAMGGPGLDGVLSSGSESDGAGAMCRATDALIRETWPVLQITRSLQDFQSPPDSPCIRRTAASFPTDIRGGARAAAALAVGPAEAGGNGGGQAENQPSVEVAGALLAGEGGSKKKGWEEDAEAEAEAFTTGASSPVGSPFPSSPGWKGDNGEADERAVSRSTAMVFPSPASRRSHTYCSFSANPACRSFVPTSTVVSRGAGVKCRTWAHLAPLGSATSLNSDSATHGCKYYLCGRLNYFWCARFRRLLWV